MSEQSFILLNIFGGFFITLLECFISIVILQFFRFSKNWQQQKTKKQKTSLITLIDLRLQLFINLFFTITLKSNIEFFNIDFFSLFLVYTIFFILLSYNFSVFHFNLFIIFCLYSFTVFLFFIESVFTFLLLLEVYSVFYYFFFLDSVQNLKQITVIKFKTLMVFYLWNSFLSSLLFSFGCYWLLINLGTQVFYELAFFDYYYDFVGVFTIFIGICWKLGLPTFQFYKIELYKFLEGTNLILFSIFSILFDYILLGFFLHQEFFFNSILYYKFFLFLLLFCLVIFLYCWRINSFQFFISFSSLLTLNFILCIFLV